MDNSIEEKKIYFENIIKEFKEGILETHPYDLAKELQLIRDIDFDEYKSISKKIPSDLFAEILSEMPNYLQEEIVDIVSKNKIANVTSKMESDDASMLIYNISLKDEEIAQEILEKLDEDDKETIEELNSYEDSQVGAYMQKEMFYVKEHELIGESLKRLKEGKDKGSLKNIFHAHIVNKRGEFIGSIGLEELILFEHSLKFSDISKDKMESYSINVLKEKSEMIDMFINYNLSALAVTNDKNKLIGRVTHDDIQSLIQEQNTKQIYSLAGVNDKAEEEVENIFLIGKNRAFWLGINLITAILASLVIGIFDTTIQSLVALAVLMPIVASMGGNAGTQTLTVTVRQMALGEIDYHSAKKTVYKEVIISLANGFLFALVIGIISYFWFNIPLLGVVIAISMIINLLSAGFFGSIIPIVLEKLKIDPAIGSTVILTTVTDIVGFFSFLGLATIILL